MRKILVTGANRGIGLELCKQLSHRGDEIIAVCRNSSAELQSLNLRVIADIDVSEPRSIEQLREQLGNEKLDWLLNNAGILAVETLDSLDFETIEQQFRVNAMGPLRVTSALSGNLSDGSKVGIITSRMGSVEDNTSGSYYGYRMSKAAVNMAGVSLAHDFKKQGIAVALLHPGMVATEMTGRQGISPTESVNGLIQRMDELEISQSGGFWHANGERLPW